MNPLLLLFVAEQCIKHVPKERKCGRVRVYTVQCELQTLYPAVFPSLRYASVRNAMSVLFPIHKNLRRRTRMFKIRATEAPGYLDSYRIRLRPLSTIARETR